MNKLEELEISAVALVDNPANPLATIEIAKAMADHAYEGDGKVCADCGMGRAQHPTMKALEPAQKGATVASETITKDEHEAVVAERDSLSSKVAELEAQVASLTPEPKTDEVDKSALPESVRKALEENAVLKADIEKMKADQRAAQFIAKAKDYGHVAPAAELAPALEAIERLAPEAYTVVERTLKAAEARITESGLFKTLGVDGERGDEDPLAKVKADAAEIRKNDPQVSEAEAMQRAMAANPELAKAAFSR